MPNRKFLQNTSSASRRAAMAKKLSRPLPSAPVPAPAPVDNFSFVAVLPSSLALVLSSSSAGVPSSVVATAPTSVALVPASSVAIVPSSVLASVPSCSDVVPSADVPTSTLASVPMSRPTSVIYVSEVEGEDVGGRSVVVVSSKEEQLPPTAIHIDDPMDWEPLGPTEESAWQACAKGIGEVHDDPMDWEYSSFNPMDWEWCD
ncbi:uncharacterized protein BYT42DRAFT_548926 [Radiomyces spectabilis]|uniref:uncharacterized protein n=1 Tax=Radiomyces spectabilis TaxID=64574 RepID=UPI002220FD87|nr:uncharacterized protein BYT42DRAFT_548926 [Radiomyces spectabilis]KAI8370712.1 hypothetical protein BYT42DRAFT_548926 [Radiomyces spectabilis]